MGKTCSELASNVDTGDYGQKEMRGETDSKDNVYSIIPEKAPDAIFHTKTQFKADANPMKMNLGVGAYRTDELRPYVLPVVQKAERLILSDLEEGNINKEYLSIGGDQDYIELSQKLILGEECPRRKSNSVAGVQTLSGTGALRVLGAFTKLFFPDTTIYLSNPTWGNHKKIFGKCNLNIKEYRYWNASERNLDYVGLLEDLEEARTGDVVVLHACAHNPTGVDPSEEQWEGIARLMERKGLVGLFDVAYQGYATGDLIKDRFSVELFARMGMSFMIAQSYSKNMGLYGERVGCASVVCSNADIAKAVTSQLCGVVRPMWSNPPKHGCYIVKRILGDSKLYDEWQDQLKGMVNRILSMRKSIRENLEILETPGSWNHITDQIGMFSYTGLTEEQVTYLKEKHHIYMLKSGRISIAGLSISTVEYFARAVDEVVRAV